MQNLHGHNILLWGATGTMGSALAQSLAQRGAHLILTGRCLHKLEALADLCEAQGGDCTLVPMTFNRLIEIDELAVHLATTYGKIHGMISCLGTLGGLGFIHHVHEKDYQEAFHIHVTIPWKTLQSFEGLLKASNQGVVLFPLEAFFQKPQGYHSVYGLSKRALVSLIDQFNLDQVPSCIKVETLYLPQAQTPLSQKIFPSQSRGFISPEEGADLIRKAYESYSLEMLQKRAA
jgi:short-subunit dehydrogenase